MWAMFFIQHGVADQRADMAMEIPARTIASLAMSLCGVVGAFAVMREQIKAMKAESEEEKSERIDEDKDVRSNLRSIFQSLDRVANSSAVVENQIKTITGILSPTEMAKNNREMGDLQARIKRLEQDIGKGK